MFSWRSLTDLGKIGGNITSHPYIFAVLLTLLVIGVDLVAGSISALLANPILAIIAIVVITKMRWWRRIGFTYSRQDARSLLLFAPVFVLPVLWWLVVAPLIGYGVMQVPSLAMVAFYAGFTLLIGFVEEVYFRGLMLQPLKSRCVSCIQRSLRRFSSLYRLAGRLRSCFRPCLRGTSLGDRSDLALDPSPCPGELCLHP